MMMQLRMTHLRMMQLRTAQCTPGEETEQEGKDAGWMPQAQVQAVLVVLVVVGTVRCAPMLSWLPLPLQ